MIFPSSHPYKKYYIEFFLFFLQMPQSFTDFEGPLNIVLPLYGGGQISGGRKLPEAI